MRPRELITNLALALTGVLISFICLEGGLRLAGFLRGPSPSPVDEIKWESEFKFYEYDPVLGWKNKAGSRGVFRTPERVTNILINSKGLRDGEHEYSKDRRFRILILGDSFVWGYGIEEGKRFTEHLQALLGDKAEVINAGVTGYGTDQELLYFREEGVKYSPDLVITAFGSYDATYDNTHSVAYTYPKPYFMLEDGKLVLKNVPVPRREWESGEREALEKKVREETPRKASFGKSLGKFLRTHFKSVALISDSIKGLRTAMRDSAKSNKKLPAYMIKTRKNRKDEAAIVLAEEILKEMNKQVKSSAAEFVVVMVPYRAHLKKLPDNVYSAILDFCDREGIRCIDPYAGFFEDYRKGNKLFFEHDKHWNESGHKLIAEEIYDYLMREKLIR